MEKQQMEPMLDLDSVPVQKTEKANRFSLDKGIDNMVGALCDPIIVHAGAWATRDMIPEWLRNQITLDRMIELMVANREGRDPVGTDSEALAYLIPASMEAPMDHDWSQIYLYLGTKVMAGAGTTMPEDIRVESLNDEQMRDLNRLKAWIYEKRKTARLDRDRAERRQKKEEEAARKEAAQPALYDF